MNEREYRKHLNNPAGKVPAQAESMSGKTKVWIRYRDGDYHASESSHPDAIEMDTVDYHEYLDHCERHQEWNDFFAKLCGDRD